MLFVYDRLAGTVDNVVALVQRTVTAQYFPLFDSYYIIAAGKTMIYESSYMEGEFQITWYPA